MSVSVLPPVYEPPTDSIFGPIITGGDVEDWTFALLKRWSCNYLSEISRQHGIEAGKLPDVRAWVPAGSFDKWPEDQIPGVLVVSNGTTERPLRQGNGSYSTRWAIRVGVICSAATQAQARRLAQLYVAAHALILIQRPSLEGYASGVDWLGEEYTPLDYDDTRSLYAGEAVFSIEVDGARFGDAGPVTPNDPLDPCNREWPPWTTVTEVDIDIEAESLT